MIILVFELGFNILRTLVQLAAAATSNDPSRSFDRLPVRRKHLLGDMLGGNYINRSSVFFPLNTRANIHTLYFAGD